MGQKQHVGIGQRMLAIAPGNLLDDHGFTAAAIDAQTHSDFGYVAPSLRYRPQAAPAGTMRMHNKAEKTPLSPSIGTRL